MGINDRASMWWFDLLKGKDALDNVVLGSQHLKDGHDWNAVVHKLSKPQLAWGFSTVSCNLEISMVVVLGACTIVSRYRCSPSSLLPLTPQQNIQKETSAGKRERGGVNTSIQLSRQEQKIIKQLAQRHNILPSPGIEPTTLQSWIATHCLYLNSNTHCSWRPNVILEIKETQWTWHQCITDISHTIISEAVNYWYIINAL